MIENQYTTEKLQLRKAQGQYWWGLLGFIPLLGAVAGVVLLLLGIFRYKDKILVLIGTGCILFTVGIYSLLFNSMKNSPEVAQGFAQISQLQVNELVKDIEFYKIQHGQYPDNLEDLQQKDNIVSIVDPILLSNSTNGNLNYRYEKVGDKYKLYSVGIDRIENTNDDIFPNISISDSIKLGFIGK